MSLRISSIFILCSAVASSVAFAQHDAHRNAMQGVAENDMKKARVALRKAELDDPETHFLLMAMALKSGDIKAAIESAQKALDLGLPSSRLVAGPRQLLEPLYQTEAYRRWLSDAEDAQLLHGPMVGSVTDSSAVFWCRTAKASSVQVVIGDRRSQSVTTAATSDFTAVLSIDQLDADTQYTYQVLINDELAGSDMYSFRTFPTVDKPARFSIAFGGGAGYRPEFAHMWDTIGAQQPLALLMLGDNVYIDQPEYLLCQLYCYYRRQAEVGWRKLTSSTATFAIYDDHDFGTDDCIPGPEIESPRWKRVAWNVFRNNWVNPSYGGGEEQPGCWFDFHIGDVHFIMLDGRYYRDQKGGSMLGPVQKAWLFETLRNSTGTFKVLASPVPWSEGVKPGSKDPWDGFPQERAEIFSFLHDQKIEGILLISADRHRTDLRKTTREQAYDLYEFESSRLTNVHVHPVVKSPGLIWGYNKTCSFGLIHFDTTQPDPLVTMESVSIDGEVTHRYKLHKSELQYR